MFNLVFAKLRDGLSVHMFAILMPIIECNDTIMGFILLQEQFLESDEYNRNTIKRDRES